MYFRVKRILVVNENIGIVVMVLTNMVYNSMAVLSCGLVGFCRIHYSLILRGHGLDRFSINTFGGCKFYCSIILLSHVYQGHKWNDYTRKGLSNWRLKNWLSGWDWNVKKFKWEGYYWKNNFMWSCKFDDIAGKSITPASGDGDGCSASMPTVWSKGCSQQSQPLQSYKFVTFDFLSKMQNAKIEYCGKLVCVLGFRSVTKAAALK
ncbi:hypothetical protein LXL04_009973 [Taraxacum kok-saghyz]